MLKKVLLLAGASVLIAALTTPATAGARDSRVETIEYAARNDDIPRPIYSDLGAGFADITLPAGPERFLSIAIEDSSGGAVAVEVLQGNRVANICGKTESPLPIRPNMPVTLNLYSGRCPDGTPSVVTTGTLTATFEKSMPAAARTQSRSYSPYTGKVGWSGAYGFLMAMVEFEPLGNKVSFKIEDATGLPALGVIQQGDDELATFCGESEAPLKISKFRPVQVWLYSGNICASGPLAARGKVIASFSP